MGAFTFFFRQFFSFWTYLMDSPNKYFRKYLKKNWTFGRYMKMKRFFFTWDENGNGFKSGTHEMFKIRVDLRFQILARELRTILFEFISFNEHFLTFYLFSFVGSSFDVM
ncbi:unnamed protein product [Rhizophagus irregularis]|nr:unnamed protein product [Rhizophagus irregularis]